MFFSYIMRLQKCRNTKQLQLKTDLYGLNSDLMACKWAGAVKAVKADASSGKEERENPG